MDIQIVEETNPAELRELKIGYFNAGYRYAYVETDLLLFGAGMSYCKILHVFYEGANFNVAVPELPKKRRNVWQCIGDLQEVLLEDKTILTLDERKAARLLPSAWRTEDLKRYYPDLVADFDLPRTLKRIVWQLNAIYYDEEVLIHPTFDRELTGVEWEALTACSVREWIDQQVELFNSDAWLQQDFEFAYFNKDFHVYDSMRKEEKSFWFPDYVPEAEFTKFKGLPFKTVPKC